jgi:hypothetical protein
MSHLDPWVSSASHSERTTQKPHQSGVYAWYHLPDVLRTECYQAIIQISKELCVAKEYLGNGLPELGFSAT